MCFEYVCQNLGEAREWNRNHLWGARILGNQRDRSHIYHLSYGRGTDRRDLGIGFPNRDYKFPQSI